MGRWGRVRSKRRIWSGRDGTLFLRVPREGEGLIMRWAEDVKVCPEIRLDEDTTAGNLAADPDGAQQRADDAVDEGRHRFAVQYESQHEPPRASADRDGVRARERYYGSATGNDG